MSSKFPIVLDPRLCDHCGRCLPACPRDALRVGRTYLKLDPRACDGCGACVKACGTGALTLAQGRAHGGAPRDAGQRQVSGGRGRPTGGASRPSRGADRARAGAAPSEKSTPRRRGSGSANGIGVLLRLSADSERPARGRFSWTLLEAVAIVSVTFSAFVVKEALSVSSWLSDLPRSLEIPARVGVLGVYYAVQIGVLVWLVRRRGGDPATALGLRGGERTIGRVLGSAGLVVGGFALTRLVASVYAYLTRAVGLIPSKQVDLPALFGSDAVGLLLAIAMVVVVGPVVEEIVFRGALLQGLSSRFGTRTAVLAQAALFAALHRSLWLFFPTFVLGVVLGYLADERKSLWPAIALHALYNAVTVAAAFVTAFASG